VALTRTLIITRHFPPHSGGAAVVMRSLVEALPNGACHVVCAHPDLYPPGTLFDPALVPEDLPATWVRTRFPFRFPGRLLPDNLAYVFGTVLAAWRIGARPPSRANALGCVVGVYPDRFGLLSALCVSLLFRLPLAAYMHDYLSEGIHGVHRLRRWWWEAVEWAVFRRAALVLAPTPHFIRRYRARGLRRLMVLPHLIPSGRQTQAPLPAVGETADETPHPLSIVFTGMLYEAHAQATEAFVRTARALPNVRLTFATPTDPGYLGAARLGPVSRAECLRMQAEADVLFLPLGIESPYPLEVSSALPSKLLDYLAAGKPILAVVPPGSYVAELIEETRAGLAVTTVEPAAIRAAIDRLRDPALRRELGANARRACARFAPDVHVKRFLCALGSLSRQPSGERVGLPAASRKRARRARPGCEECHE
jgi:glycosyltransferase involved in cell wall biosynthesis